MDACQGRGCSPAKRAAAAAVAAEPQPDVEVDCSEACCEEYSCRICFEDVLKPTELISPCKCLGTLKYVHPGCLFKWQSAVVKLHGHHDERAYICSVCRTPYTICPPHPLDRWRKVGQAARRIAGAACISLLALGLTGGPPLLHLAILLLLLASTRSQSLVLLLVILAVTLLATLYVRGLRLVVRMDARGQYGVAVICHSGAAVPGLAPGALLVASRQLDGTLFSQSVVLLYEAGPHGAKGVMLTQPIDSGGVLLFNRPLATRLAAASAVRHYMGGPVGADFRGGPGSELVALHHHAALAGARQVVASAGAPATQEVLPAAGVDAGVEAGLPAGLSWRQRLLRHQPLLAALQADAAAAAAAAAGEQQQQHLGLYLGGSVDELLSLLAAPAAGAAPAAAPGVPGALLQMGPPPAPQARLFHGICAWAPGQLEGELRSGAWGLAEAAPADVMATPPQQLWHQLVVSPRLRWM